MNKRISLIITSILQILLSIYSIIFSDTIIKSMIESLSTYPDATKERIELLFQNSGNLYITILGLLCIIFNIIILYTCIKNKNIIKKKELLITCIIISFFLSTNSIIELISIINMLIVFTMKRTKEEDYPIKEKKEIPKLNRTDTSKKDIILATILILSYFSQLIWGIFIPENITLNNLLKINTIFDIIMLILTLLIFYSKLKRDITLFKNNFKAYIQYVLPKLGKMYLVYFILSSIAIALAGSSTSVNQETLESLPLIYTIPTAILWAPIVEEVIFRGCLRRFIKKDNLYIIISALIFGLLHTMNETTITNMLLLSVPYSILGGFFAYLYAKTDNLTNNILCHSLHNTVAMIMSLLLIG